MFRNPNEATSRTYRTSPRLNRWFTRNQVLRSCYSFSTVNKIENCMHIDYLNGILISVELVCDQKETIVFTKFEETILDITSFSATKYKIIKFIPQNNYVCLYELPKSKHFPK